MLSAVEHFCKMGLTNPESGCTIEVFNPLKHSREVKALKNKLRQIRKQKRMSQDELAKLSGVSRVTISNIERGKNENISAKTLLSIAAVLGTTIDEIFFNNAV